MQALNFQMARKTVKFYCCSNCWGELEMKPEPTGKPDMHIVTCRNCKDDTKGYVTKHFVDRRRQESEFEKRDVTRTLKSIGVIKKEDRTAAQILQEMGF